MPHQFQAGPSVRVTRLGGIWAVVSSPYPIHWGTIPYSSTLGRWLFVCETAGVATRDFRQREQAIAHGGLIIGTLYRTDMRSRFTGPQRLAMGRTQCPAHVPCRDVAECPLPIGHLHLCKGVPEPVSVWCQDHRDVMEGVAYGRSRPVR